MNLVLPYIHVIIANVNLGHSRVRYDPNWISSRETFGNGSIRIRGLSIGSTVLLLFFNVDGCTWKCLEEYLVLFASFVDVERKFLPDVR